MKPQLHTLEPRDVPSSTAWLDAAGILRIETDDPGILMQQLPVGDPRLPAYALAHPEAFVGTATADFWWVQDRDGSVWLGHVDAVKASNVVPIYYGPAPGSGDGGTTSTTTGAGTSGTTPTSSTTGTGGATDEPQTASLQVSGKKEKGGGCYTSHGGIHVDHGHHKPAKHHGKHK
jgi:hypothetical protein